MEKNMSNKIYTLHDLNWEWKLSGRGNLVITEVVPRDFQEYK